MIKGIEPLSHVLIKKAKEKFHLNDLVCSEVLDADSLKNKVLAFQW